VVSEATGQDPSAEPSWPDVPWGYSDGDGVYACGSDFAAPDDSASDRHAEICFFGSNMEPTLTAPAPGEKATLEDYPVEDPEKIAKVKLEVQSPSPSDEAGTSGERTVTVLTKDGVPLIGAEYILYGDGQKIKGGRLDDDSSMTYDAENGVKYSIRMVNAGPIEIEMEP